MFIARTLGLFIVTAAAEIVGCYLPYLWLKKGASAWLLSLHPTAAGRVYAAYGGVYVSVAMLWLWLVDAVRPTVWDVVGGAICLAGMAVIMLGSHPA
jgi:small multidrug resistance family-3 protein